MANRGESKSSKRISCSAVRRIRRKQHKWTIKSRPGKHAAETSVPLAVVLRDLLEVVGNLREAKHIIRQGMVKVDGKVRKDHRFSVGLFDVIDLEATKKRYRAVFDRKGRLELREINAKEKPEKLVKIVGKHYRGGNQLQLQLNDGSTLMNPKGTFKTGDTLKISLPDNKIIEQYEEKSGNLIYLIGGTKVGSFARLENISEGTINKKKLVDLELEKTKFQTIERNVFVVGNKNQPAVDMGESHE